MMRGVMLGRSVLLPLHGHVVLSRGTLLSLEVSLHWDVLLDRGLALHMTLDRVVHHRLMADNRSGVVLLADNMMLPSHGAGIDTHPAVLHVTVDSSCLVMNHRTGCRSNSVTGQIRLV